MNEIFHASIHFRLLIWARVVGAAAAAVMSRLMYCLRHSDASRDTEALQNGFGGPWGLMLVGYAPNTSPERRPRGIRSRCLSHFNWLLSTWGGSCSPLSTSWMTKLLTLSRQDESKKFGSEALTGWPPRTRISLKLSFSTILLNSHSLVELPFLIWMCWDPFPPTPHFTYW